MPTTLKRVVGFLCAYAWYLRFVWYPAIEGLQQKQIYTDLCNLEPPGRSGKVIYVESAVND